MEETIKSLWFCVLSLNIQLLTSFPGGKKQKFFAGICMHTVNYVYGEKERVIYEKDPEPMPISQTHTHTQTHTITRRPARCIANTMRILLRPRSDVRYVCSAYMAPKIRYLAPKPAFQVTNNSKNPQCRENPQSRENPQCKQTLKNANYLQNFVVTNLLLTFFIKRIRCISFCYRYG
jgi:hypothetical protein